MEVLILDTARATYDEFDRAPAADRRYDRLWDVLDRILADPDEARHAGWVNYVSTFDLWGSKVPATDYTVFWRIKDGALIVALIEQDLGV